MIQILLHLVYLVLVNGQAVSQPPSQPGVRAITSLMYELIIVLIIVVFGLSIVLVLGRRFRATLGRKRMGPTEASDVWAMHIPPNIEDEDDVAEDEDKKNGEQQ